MALYPWHRPLFFAPTGGSWKLPLRPIHGFAQSPAWSCPLLAGIGKGSSGPRCHVGTAGLPAILGRHFAWKSLPLWVYVATVNLFGVLVLP